LFYLLFFNIRSEIEIELEKAAKKAFHDIVHRRAKEVTRSSKNRLMNRGAIELKESPNKGGKLNVTLVGNYNNDVGDGNSSVVSSSSLNTNEAEHLLNTTQSCFDISGGISALGLEVK
jgi:hypothetical protein